MRRHKFTVSYDNDTEALKLPIVYYKYHIYYYNKETTDDAIMNNEVM